MDPILLVDSYEIPLDKPKTINLTLNAGVDHRGDYYFILGGASGTYPGSSLPGDLSLPLNMDFLTNLIIVNPNCQVFQNFSGVLDSNGKAQAAINTQGIIPLNPHLAAQLAGIKLYFSGVIWPSGKPFETAMNVKVLYLE